jgi:ATP-dependent exoDNAse (exonuclease V) beta subunit
VHAALKQAGDNGVNSALSGLKDISERERVQLLIDNALASSVLVRAKAATECFSALPFVWHREDRLLEGVIDFTFIEDGAWVVVDLDTAAIAGAEAEGVLVYRPQLSVCALALEQLTNRPVKELVLLFMHSGQEVNCPWGDDERAYAETLLSRTVHPSTSLE